MAIQSGATNPLIISGLSTDTKPSGPGLQNAIFRETDTGKTYQYSGTAWGISNTSSQLSDPNGNNLNFATSPGGYQLPITPVPTLLMGDNFNGTTIDTVNRWQSPVIAGTGTMTQAGGQLVATVGTTASNGATISTIENFDSSIGNITVGALLQTDAVFTTNNHRVFGFGTRPGVPTAANPVQDGYVWEVDITGVFRASIYNSGTRIASTVFANSGTTFIPIAIGYSGLNVNFFYNNFSVPVLTVPVSQPSTLNLPFIFGSINHTSVPSSAPTWSTYGLQIVDGAGNKSNVFNGQTLSAARSPSVFKNINAVSIATETTIWTPASGRRFRLMGYILESGTIGGNVLLKDNTGGSTIAIVPFGAANGVITTPPWGNGILSGAVNNVLTATGVATQTLSGMVWGCEE